MPRLASEAMRSLRHGSSILLLPVTVTVLVPWWIARADPSPLTPPRTVAAWLLAAFGLVLLVAGAALFIGSLRRFDSDGHGTLAPWDPPRHLVIRGPYAYVRNPMITGVVLLLLAESALLRSSQHLAWAGIFALINAIFIPLLEEPILRSRFGVEYDEYARHVPRLVPRRRPWCPTEEGGGDEERGGR